MASSDAELRSNFVLSRLSPAEYDEVAGRLEVIDVELKTPVYESGRPFEHIFFPLRSVFSYVTTVDGEMVVEVGTVGREGMVGVPAFLGATTSPHTAFSQIAGPAGRMTVKDFESVLTGGDGGLRRQLQRYVQCLLVQLAQNVACSRLHTTEERAARWLLVTADRVDADAFPLTHEFLAQMLGVRRPTASLTAGVLQSAGLIAYRRGRVEIVDRDGLHQAACDCYDIVRAEFDAVAGE